MNYRPLSLALILAFTGLTSLAGCEKSVSLTDQEHIQRAKDFEDKGNLNSSIVELKNAIQKNPDNAQARLLLGQIYLKAGMGAEAEKELTQATKLGVNSESVKPQLGKALVLMGEYKRVLAEVQPGEQTSPANLAQILQLQGDAKLGLRKLDEACDLYRKSIEANSSHVPGYWGMAKCALFKNDPAAARQQLDDAIKVDPRNADTWVMLGDLARHGDNAQEAENAYGQALKIQPDHNAALVSRTLLFISRSQPEKAEVDLKKISQIAPEHYLLHYLQGALLYSTGKYAQAMEAVQKALKANPGYAPAMRLAGILHYNLNAHEQAIQSLRQYLQKVPGDALMHKLLAAAYLKTGRADLAMELLKPMLNRSKDDAQLYILAGEASLKSNDPAAAARQFEKAAAIDPGNLKLQTQLGLSLFASGDKQKGVEELQSNISADPRQIHADVSLAVVYLQERQYDKALETLGTLEKKLAKEDPFVHELRGVAYVGKNDPANARLSFERALALDPSLASSAINLAQLDLHDKNPSMAKKRLQRALEKKPNDLSIIFALAGLLRAEGNEKEFLALLNQAARAHPKLARPHVQIAQFYLGKNQPKLAQASAQAALNAEDDNPDALAAMGNAQLALGNQDGALTTFKRLAARAPGAATSHYFLASAQASGGNLAGARQSLKRALEIKPDNIEVLIALAAVEARDGKAAESLKIAQQVKKLAPASPLGAAMEGDALMITKRYAQAAQAYESAFSRHRNGGLLIKLHDALVLSGARANAESRMLQWLKEQPNDKLARLHFAQSLMSAGANQSAIEQYQFLLKREPNNALLLNNLAWLYHKEKNPRAMEYAERAYKLQPEAAFILDTLGWISLEQGKVQRGLELLNKALALAPDNPSIKFHVAAALARNGDKSGARRLLEELLSKNNAFPQQQEARALLSQL